MNIPLHGFEQHIEDKVLKRGLDYFQGGQVAEPEEVAPGVYEAVVYGTEDYLVRLELKSEEATAYTCTCPYDFGPVCKHIAAVLFSLKQETKKAPSKKKPQKRKTLAGQVDELLEAASPAELKAFIREQTQMDRDFRQLFLVHFTHRQEGESKELYARQIRGILRSRAGRGHFLDWRSAQFVGLAVDKLLNTAEKHLEERSYRSTFLICGAVLEEMTKALQFADDSNGDIGGPLDSALSLLYKLSDAQLPEELRKEILNYCLEAQGKGTFSSWDSGTPILDIAAELAGSEHEAREVMELLDQPSGGFRRDASTHTKLKLIRKLYGEEAAEEYQMEHRSHPAHRSALIEQALARQDYEKVTELAQEAIRQERPTFPAADTQWHEWLLKVAQARQDKKQIIQLARHLFLSNTWGNEVYYKLMKQHVPHEEWEAFVQEVIKEVNSRKHWDNTTIIADIYVREQKWDQLMALLQAQHTRRSLDLSYIARYESYLAKDFPAELVEMYEDGILKQMEFASSREEYRNLCSYIRRINQLGAVEEAEAIVQALREAYPRRRAMLDELSKV